MFMRRHYNSLFLIRTCWLHFIGQSGRLRCDRHRLQQSVRRRRGRGARRSGAIRIREPSNCVYGLRVRRARLSFSNCFDHIHQNASFRTVALSLLFFFFF